MQNDQINERLATLADALANELSMWRFPRHVTREEVQAEAIEALWHRERRDQAQVRQPIRWLLATAKRKRLEISRRNHMERVSNEQISRQIAASNPDRHEKSRGHSLDLIRSWESLAPE